VSGTGDYILGVIGLVGVVLSMAIAGRTARRAALPGWTGAPAVLADAILAVGILVLVAELLGLVGLLDGVLLFAACLIVGGGALRLEPMLIRAGARVMRGRATERPVSDWGKSEDAADRPAPHVGRIELGVTVVIALVVAAQWAGPTLLALDRGIYGGDSLWYHLPLAAHIAGTGSITELLYTDPLYLNWFYPQVSELLHGGGLLLFGNDFLSPLMNVGWLGLALFAGWCIGRPYGAGPTAMAAVASVMAADLLFSRQPGNANNDVVAIALFLAAVAILINTRRREGAEEGVPIGALLVAGVAAGLALGTKLTVVPPVLALTLGVIYITGAGERLRASGIWIGGLLVGGGYWYMRNLIVSGNPFPWQDIGPIPHAEALHGRDPYSIAHYATDTDVWGEWFTPALEERLGDLWPAYLGLAVIAVLLVLWRGGRMERMLAAVALVSAIAYLFTPLGASGPEGSPVGFRLNMRYLAPGLILALTLLSIPPPFARGRERIWGLATLAIFAVLIVVSAGAPEAIDTDRIPGAVALALSVIALPLALVLLWRRRVSPIALTGAALAAVIALAVFGRFAQEDYLELRYSSAAPQYPRTEHPGTELGQGLDAAYDWARSTRDRRIALSGTLGALFQYGLWGEGASNEVVYLGQKEERGSFEEIAECPEWIGAINSGDFDFVVTTPTYNQDNPAADTAPVQRSWIENGGNVGRVGGAGLVDVWQITGPVDPNACVAAATP
jgi:hypothetical protein